jgi:hypothetical protein
MPVLLLTLQSGVIRSSLRKLKPTIISLGIKLISHISRLVQQLLQLLVIGVLVALDCQFDLAITGILCTTDHLKEGGTHKITPTKNPVAVFRKSK